MFERRLKILLFLLAVPAVGILLRLFHLQVLNAAYYQDASKRLLPKWVRDLPCLRGEIQDHEGRRLAYDAPAWDICVHYKVLADDPAYFKKLAKRPGSPSAAELAGLVGASWQTISRLSGTPVEELQRGQTLYRSIQRTKELVSRAQGIETEVAEETTIHAIVRGLNQNQQVTARVELAAYPWVEVVSSHIRQYDGGDSLGHLLGALNQVNDADIADDVRRDQDLARYRQSDLHGISGAEALGEEVLRGLRGYRRETDAGVETVEPVNGRNFRMTIDLPLQQMVYDRMAAAVKENKFATGGSAVVIDIPSRQVLALVSYPGYDPNMIEGDRRRLLTDEVYRPWRFRAVAEHYPPGSLVKPVVLAGAWTDGVVGDATRFTCYGQLFPGGTGWGCLGHHNEVDPVEAIQKSCNVFFYHIGQDKRMGVARLAWWMEQAGFGRTAGTGLIEEIRGGLPRKDEPGAGDARNTAIGQGQVDVTPLQAANMTATIASGVYRPVTLWADDPSPRAAQPFPASREALRKVRLGMYKVVNEEGGTAHTHISLNNTGELVLLGKTGSAEVEHGRVIERIFVCQFADGSTEELVAANDIDLVTRYPRTRTAKILERRSYRSFPADEDGPTHAWFIGYLTTRDRYLESSAAGRLNVAVAVLIEFGGRGGGVAAPVAGEIVQAMIDMQTPHADAGHAAARGTARPDARSAAVLLRPSIPGGAS